MAPVANGVVERLLEASEWPLILGTLGSKQLFSSTAISAAVGSLECFPRVESLLLLAEEGKQWPPLNRPNETFPVPEVYNGNPPTQGAATNCKGTFRGPGMDTIGDEHH